MKTVKVIKPSWGSACWIVTMKQSHESSFINAHAHAQGFSQEHMQNWTYTRAKIIFPCKEKRTQSVSLRKLDSVWKNVGENKQSTNLLSLKLMHLNPLPGTCNNGLYKHNWAVHLVQFHRPLHLAINWLTNMTHGENAAVQQSEKPTFIWSYRKLWYDTLGILGLKAFLCQGPH